MTDSGHFELEALVGPLAGWRFPVHDETYEGEWLCGECPYMNVGPICTKCGAWVGSGVIL